MSLNNNQDSVTFELEYKATNDSQIQLFGSDFVDNNKDKCKIIYNEKEYDLMEYFKFDNNYNHNNPIKIQLRLNNNITYISNIFSFCKELLSNIYLSVDNFNINDINNSFDGNNSNNFSEKADNSNEINDLNYFKENIFTNVTDMSYMFYECSSLISLPDISKWDTKNVTNMYSMFKRCSSLISLPDISKWDSKNVTNMEYMFLECSSLISLPDISK